MNAPIHFNFKDEMIKATRIVSTIQAMPDGEYMVDLMKHAVGLIFMTTVKVGGGLSGMGGSGLLLSKLGDGSWSAPIAVGAMGLSIGFQVGLSVADVVIIFMKRSAMEPFTNEVKCACVWARM